MNDFFIRYSGILYLIQLFFAIVIGLYFWNLLKNQQSRKTVMFRESQRESLKLQEMRSVKLTEPLSSVSKPASFNDIVGQEEGIDLLRSALCGPNPQHVIIYGPPGVGKTAAARLVLEEAKENSLSPFQQDARFVEMDATICRFDERNIADPLIGSVHDPIYQGAGAMGAAGIPQPKPGACTKANGGVLFIDEIGELHPVQMNKLLKVLEDRKVMLESAYYAEDDKNLPRHIHDIFQNGLPADFRLVAATTRMPQEIPPALRSRCMEVFFKPLDISSIKLISSDASKKINFKLEEEALNGISQYATNGREAVNMVQLSAGIAQMLNQNRVTQDIVQKVINNGRFSPRCELKVRSEAQIGMVNGLAVSGANVGTLLEIEASVISVEGRKGEWRVTGVVEEEELGGGQGKTYRRKSMAKGAIENVMTVLKSHYGIEIANYDIHVNFPGGIPVDGPSAGVGMTIALYSSLYQIPVDNYLAMTGEISIHGKIKPVGGVLSKVEGARKAGVKKVLIPQENWLNIFDDFADIEIKAVSNLNEVLEYALITG